MLAYKMNIIKIHSFTITFSLNNFQLYFFFLKKINSIFSTIVLCRIHTHLYFIASSHTEQLNRFLNNFFEQLLSTTIVCHFETMPSYYRWWLKSSVTILPNTLPLLYSYYVEFYNKKKLFSLEHFLRLLFCTKWHVKR